MNDATAYRRAAVLIKHHLAGDIEGINAVLTEVDDDGRLAPLLGALIGSLTEIANHFLTDTGREALNEMITDLAENYTTPNLSTPRAARYLMAVFNHAGQDAADAAMYETEDVSPLIVGLLELHTRLVPVMTTDIALDILDNGIRAFMHKEEGGDIE